jgi:hypothetical protein
VPKWTRLERSSCASAARSSGSTVSIAGGSDPALAQKPKHLQELPPSSIAGSDHRDLGREQVDEVDLCVRPEGAADHDAALAREGPHRFRESRLADVVDDQIDPATAGQVAHFRCPAGLRVVDRVLDACLQSSPALGLRGGSREHPCSGEARESNRRPTDS